METGKTPVKSISVAVSTGGLAHRVDDLRGKAVVDVNGHRIGEVSNLVTETHGRGAHLLVVVSGGVLGLRLRERLIPIDVVRTIDHRVHVDLTNVDERFRSAEQSTR